jgi:predicted porin
VQRTLLFSTAAVLAFAAAGHADELSDIKAQSKQLRDQNQALTKRLADIEKRQKKLEAQPKAQPAVSVGNPADAMGADLPYKAMVKKAPEDDGICYHGVCAYGLIDMGLTYQNHGAPLNSIVGSPLNNVISKNSNGSYFGAGPNSLSTSFIGLKGRQEVADDLYAVVNLQTGFNPESGTVSNGLGSVAQNNGLPITRQNAFSDSSRNGQAFSNAAYAGLSSPVYGTLTYGRQSALTSDAIVNYDPMGNSLAFSLVGFQGAIGGAGTTEDRIYDNSFEYRANAGPFRFAVEASLRSGNNSGTGNAFEGDVGFDYMGLSMDFLGARIYDAVSAAPLSAAQLAVAPAIGIPSASVSGTIFDNTAFMAVAKYSIGAFKLYGGYEYIEFANPNNPLPVGSFLQGSFTLGAVNNTNFTTDKILQVAWVGVRYAARADLDLTVAFFHEWQNSFIIGNGSNPTGTCSTNVSAGCSGQLDAVSALADWRFAKHFDAYAGMMWSQVSNGLSNGFLQRSSIDPTVGLRYQF